MDSARASIGLATACSNLSNLTNSVRQGLQTLHQLYNSAGLEIDPLLDQITNIDGRIFGISAWIQQKPAALCDKEIVLQALTCSLTVCTALLYQIRGHVEAVKLAYQYPGVRRKGGNLWNAHAIQEHTRVLSDQSGLMRLLLQYARLDSRYQRQVFLNNPENMKTLDHARIDRASSVYSKEGRARFEARDEKSLGTLDGTQRTRYERKRGGDPQRPFSTEDHPLPVPGLRVPHKTVVELDGTTMEKQSPGLDRDRFSRSRNDSLQPIEGISPTEDRRMEFPEVREVRPWDPLHLNQSSPRMNPGLLLHSDPVRHGSTVTKASVTTIADINWQSSRNSLSTESAVPPLQWDPWNSWCGLMSDDIYLESPTKSPRHTTILNELPERACTVPITPCEQEKLPRRCNGYLNARVTDMVQEHLATEGSNTLKSSTNNSLTTLGGQRNHTPERGHCVIKAIDQLPARVGNSYEAQNFPEVLNTSTSNTLEMWFPKSTTSRRLSMSELSHGRTPLRNHLSIRNTPSLESQTSTHESPNQHGPPPLLVMAECSVCGQAISIPSKFPGDIDKPPYVCDTCAPTSTDHDEPRWFYDNDSNDDDDNYNERDSLMGGDCECINCGRSFQTFQKLNQHAEVCSQAESPFGTDGEHEWD